ncbi:MAG: hypothetical protein V1750_04375 [Acidobacteriota bacterium]
MRAKYSIGVAGLLLGAFAAADTCPPGLLALAAEVKTLRQVPAPFAPPCRLLPAASLAAELDRKLRRDLPLAPELYLEALERIGMIDAAGGLYPRLLTFYASQVLGFYEPASDEMVVVDAGNGEDPQARLLWAHELAHAAQEHRFGLPTRLLGMGRNGDAQRAASAVAEGEAMLVMLLLSSARTDAELTAAQDALASQAEQLAAPPGIPEYFVRDLLFPYTAGLEAVLRAYRAGGWRAVDELLRNLPASTACLLHPQQSAPGPPLADADLLPLPAGYQKVLTDTLGEWGLRHWLSRWLPTAEAGRLAAGWDSDRLLLARATSDPASWTLAWKLRCRSPAARAEIEAVLRRGLSPLLAGLAGQAAPVELTWAAGEHTLELRAGWPQ